MFISKFQVFNYKSYLDSGLIQFTPGINIIVGQNNSGKTSLLEAFTLNFDNQPHLSLKTFPTKSKRINQESQVKVSLLIQKEELLTFLKDIQSPIGILEPAIIFDDEESAIQYYMDLRNESPPEAMDMRNNLIVDIFKKFKNFLDTSEHIEINLSIFSKFKLETSTLEKLSTFEFYSPVGSTEKGEYTFYKIKYDEDEELIIEINEDLYDWINSYQAQINESMGYKLFEFFAHKIYRFKAERLIIGNCRFENNPELKSDMSNLAEVLSILQGINPERFRRFNDYVSSVLPQIKGVSVRHQDDSIVEIMIWTIDPKSERDDLSFPLASCGTGVSQVLVILCILITSQEPRTIIIDEPQSFLHPGAAKKLIETLKQFPQHQYFIATHSPEIIASANPSTIIKLQYQDCETTASVINTKDIESQNEILAELGVRLSDVFGADNILWVEGQTEEKCFPLVLEKIASIPLMGIKILSVNSTDALLDGKRSDLVFDIYKKLTTGATLFPPAIGFIFDRENKTEAKIQELEKRGANFLRLPMYENYLLDPEPISMVINEEARWLETPISITQVQEYLDKIKQEKSYLLQGVKREQVSDNNWLYKIHGAKILESMFQELCENKLEFRKTKHSYKLTEWLVENKPDFLSELAEELGNYLKKNQ
ncbi:AAA family ATPase [Desmonostoc muscorum LEGE 12446]|uniref:AAA family ATPase n=1 Tax=Desmonostoc muscorum LEGE 12446 TaxID=1828758 RepID=A0A8J7ADH5_DESMC|nr:AAA family ATPase [Desmonostoc muscorum]MCF2146149.1 AAA family ATPase [Desmonostoc muscorum LEGE 12446]